MLPIRWLSNLAIVLYYSYSTNGIGELYCIDVRVTVVTEFDHQEDEMAAKQISMRKGILLAGGSDPALHSRPCQGRKACCPEIAYRAGRAQVGILLHTPRNTDHGAHPMALPWELQ
jgi:hypothetical protein